MATLEKLQEDITNLLLEDLEASKERNLKYVQFLLTLAEKCDILDK